jgi:hypothetical protein
MMEAVGSSETSVISRATLRHIPEDGILQICISCMLVSHKIQLSKLVEFDQSRKSRLTAVGIRCAGNTTLSALKSWN